MLRNGREVRQMRYNARRMERSPIITKHLYTHAHTQLDIYVNVKCRNRSEKYRYIIFKNRNQAKEGLDL